MNWITKHYGKGLSTWIALIGSVIVLPAGLWIGLGWKVGLPTFIGIVILWWSQRNTK